MENAHPKELPAFADLRGVYRFRHKVDGCTMWYAVNDRRQIIGVKLVPPGEDDAAAVVELATIVYGGEICTPLLTLHRGPSASAVCALLTRPSRGRLSVSPGGSPS